MSPDVAHKIHALVAPAVESAGYELVEAQWKREPSGWVVRLLIDAPSGVGHHDCERVSREVSTLLDVHDVIPYAYNLEVSSPGLDRPLFTTAHFRRFLGKRVKARLKLGVDGRRNYTGTIVDADESKFVLEVDGVEHALPLADLDRAQLVVDLDIGRPVSVPKRVNRKEE
jgi:ribosome maturation factor RimP